MAETLIVSQTADRAAVYREIVPQIAAIIDGERDTVANLANIAAAIKQAFGYFWVGFYVVKGGELVVGPFQGPIACSRIAYGRGVCGAAYSSREVQIVPDVDKFPGHIACASESRSEVVVPIFSPTGEVWGVLDVDSDKLDYLNEKDAAGLQAIVRILEKKLSEETA
ncbi:MAG TPA: GAF domain-containing protein [Pyrinomonadaceae bacterium]|nr:GAF domain-containing protein [Pyrinomonadaceae bacterium]